VSGRAVIAAQPVGHPAPLERALARALEKLGRDDEAFVILCANRRDHAKEPCCAAWKLSYEQYYLLRERFAQRIEAKWLLAGYSGNFAAMSLPAEDA
jgi:hypothetical protein